jgi:MoxR-like ATPase
VFVEGNADLTTGKLVGHHDPAEALSRGFSEHTFIEGPLLRAMRTGGFLYVEEVNRAPEETLNALLTAIAEREISVPRVGVVHAAPGFRLVASMNPFDNIGTSRISTSVYDRLCRVAIGYQSAADEIAIVERRTEQADPRVVEDAVALTRLTRKHPLVRQGSSVRGAIDLVLVAAQLLVLDPPGDEARYAATIRDALHVALSGRIRLDEASATTPEAILDELWEQHFVLSPRIAAPG